MSTVDINIMSIAGKANVNYRYEYTVYSWKS